MRYARAPAPPLAQSLHQHVDVVVQGHSPNQTVPSLAMETFIERAGDLAREVLSSLIPAPVHQRPPPEHDSPPMT